MLLCNRMKPQNILRLGLAFFAIAALTRVFVHPATDFSRGFVHGFTGALLGASIVFLLTYMIKYRRADSGPCA